MCACLDSVLCYLRVRVTHVECEAQPIANQEESVLRVDADVRIVLTQRMTSSRGTTRAGFFAKRMGLDSPYF